MSSTIFPQSSPEPRKISVLLFLSTTKRAPPDAMLVVPPKPWMGAVGVVGAVPPSAPPDGLSEAAQATDQRPEIWLSVCTRTSAWVSAPGR